MKTLTSIFIYPDSEPNGTYQETRVALYQRDGEWVLPQVERKVSALPEELRAHFSTLAGWMVIKAAASEWRLRSASIEIAGEVPYPDPDAPTPNEGEFPAQPLFRRRFNLPLMLGREGSERPVAWDSETHMPPQIREALYQFWDACAAFINAPEPSENTPNA